MLRQVKPDNKTALKASLQLNIRFSEVDSMNIVWHGSYPLYFEDAREEFGRRYNLGYLRIAGEGFYAPLVDLEFHYRRPLKYGTRPRIDIYYRPTEAAKLIFDYEIRDSVTDELMATGRSVQVFMDKDYNLLWSPPEFYVRWKEQWGV